MSSIGFNPQSVLSQNSQYDQYYQENFNKEQDDAQFFSVANQYKERKVKMTNFRAMQAMNMAHNFNIKNNPKELFKTDQIKEKVRKTRSDQQGRQFICGACKSGYLSYPALYTHIKTKHNGVAPQGTIRGKNNNNKKRGRPKSIRKQPQFHYDKQPQNVFPKQYMDLVQKSQISNAYQEEQDDIEDRGQITMPIFVKQIKQLRKSNLRLCTLPLIKVLAIYLHNIKSFMRLQVFETIQMISSKLVNIINEQYHTILANYQNQSKFFIRKTLPVSQPTKSKHTQKNITVTYCQYEKCDYFPVFVYYLLKKLDPEDDQIQCEFLIDLCNWLYEKKLTAIKIMKSNILETSLVQDDEDQQ